MSNSITTNGSSSVSSPTSNGMPELGVDSSSSASSASGVSGRGVGATGIDRLKELEAVFCDGPESVHEAKAFSTETLLDILLILYNECCNTSLRKEKTVTDFIELGKT